MFRFGGSWCDVGYGCISVQFLRSAILCVLVLRRARLPRGVAKSAAGEPGPHPHTPNPGDESS